MRVIAGTAKGRRLESPKGARPTSDKVREAMFSSIGERVKEARVLDLFSGSGALGIEALSRGASECVFVESDRRAVAAIERNLAMLGLTNRSSIERGEVAWFLNRNPGPFDLVLMDPPYATDMDPAIWESLRQGVLQDGGLVVVEARSGYLPDAPGFQTRAVRKYGGTTLIYMTREEN